MDMNKVKALCGTTRFTHQLKMPTRICILVQSGCNRSKSSKIVNLAFPGPTYPFLQILVFLDLFCFCLSSADVGRQHNTSVEALLSASSSLSFSSSSSLLLLMYFYCLEMLGYPGKIFNNHSSSPKGL